MYQKFPEFITESNDLKMTRFVATALNVHRLGSAVGSASVS